MTPNIGETWPRAFSASGDCFGRIRKEVAIGDNLKTSYSTTIHAPISASCVNDSPS